MSVRALTSMRTVVWVLLVGLLAGACGSTPPSQPANASLPATSGPTVSPSAESLPPTASPSPSIEPTPTPEPTPILVAAPLTGLLVTPAQARRHPIAVMVDDLSAARPQSGFSSASVVWQAPAEGGIPRYMMIFGETRPTDVGPVRSSRYYYIAWAAEWKAVYAHAGGSPQALDTLRAKGNGQLVYNADEFRWAGSFRRITSRFAPHNLYTTGKQLDSLAKRLGAKAGNYKPVWQFAPDAPLEARPVGGKISFAYSTSPIRYDYDRNTNTYLRTVSVEGKQKDAATKKRVAPKNVVVMLMSFGPLNDGHPKKHRLEAKVVGSGVSLDRHQRQDDQGHLAQEVADRADEVLQRGRRRSHPDRRPDLRQCHAARDPGQDHQRRSAAAARVAIARRLAVSVAGRRPAGAPGGRLRISPGPRARPVRARPDRAHGARPSAESARRAAPRR